VARSSTPRRSRHNSSSGAALLPLKGWMPWPRNYCQQRTHPNFGQLGQRPPGRDMGFRVGEGAGTARGWALPSAPLPMWPNV
jgi:hypothetical protein